ncbi:MAG: signal peptidase I [Eubacteriales bacterium]
MKFMDKIQLGNWIKTFIFLVMIIALLHWFIIPVRVNGRSMENALNNKDIMLVSKIVTVFKGIDRGDMIVIDVNKKDYSSRVVKRVIGIQGDHIVIKNGVVFVNGEKIVEDYSKGETTGDIDMIVEKDNVFILGDNRTISKDSRSYGSVSLKNIKGKVIIKFSL